MLRLGPLDFASDAPGLPAVSPQLVARALGDLISERTVRRHAGFAIEALCAALVADAPKAAQENVDRLLACGVGVEAIYDTYIPGAAARLGEMWLDDLLSFTEVALGLARLTEIFRTLGPSFHQARPRSLDPSTGRRALFALTPGESHALGVVMAADYFQSHGWSVRVELRADAADLVRIAGARPFDVIGLSAGSRRSLPGLLRLMERLRAVAAPSTRFALGGALVGLDDTLPAQLGADVALCATPRSIDALAVVS